MIVSAALVGAAVLGVGAAFLAVTLRQPSSGALDTELENVSVIEPTAPPPTPRPKPPPAPTVDRQCWPMFGGDRSRSLARPGIDLGVPARPPLWARGLKAYVEYPPSYCDGVLYVNTFRGDTWAIDSATGKVVWKRASRAPKASTPAIAGPYVIVSSHDGSVTALDRRNGKRVWQVTTGAKVESSPAVVEGVAYFGATDGHLFAVDALTGAVRWAYDTGGRINSSPSLTRGRVCITTYAGSILCLRRSDGTKVWSTFVKRDAFRYESFYASASTDGERLYTMARSGKVVALAVEDGDVLWTREVGTLGYTTPAVGADRIFVGDFRGQLRAYRKRDGEELWRSWVGGRVLGSPVVVGDLVFFSTLEQKTYAARVSDGKIVWRFHLGKYSPGIATERAYYFTLNGILVAFRGKDGPKPTS